MDKSICKLLLVDNSDDDRLLVRRAVTKHSRFHIVGEVCDGEDAIAYLSGQTIFSDREKYPFPDIMLLDLKMPKTTGYEVLEWLQTQTFERLKVVALSGSYPHEDLARTVELGAHAYQMKSGLAPGEEALVAKLEALVDGREHPPIPRGEKWTSTMFRNWVAVARSLAKTANPFLVKDVETNLHRIACSAIASDYGLLQQLVDETTMRFTPLTRPATALKPRPDN
jgi:CheY-like chemotaxis protein